MSVTKQAVLFTLSYRRSGRVNQSAQARLCRGKQNGRVLALQLKGGFGRLFYGESLFSSLAIAAVTRRAETLEARFMTERSSPNH